jgi:hypothetical protein
MVRSGTAGRTRAKARRKILVVLALYTLAGGPRILRCAAQNHNPPLDYQVKAAFLLNFTKFVEWPSSAFPSNNTPITICLTGEDPFGGALQNMVAGEVVNGRSLVVQRVGSRPPAGCRVVFVDRSQNTSRILANVGEGVLTVGEGEEFLREGGMIGFVIENRRVRFDINQAATARGGLKASSRLLSVARSVRK